MRSTRPVEDPLLLATMAATAVASAEPIGVVADLALKAIAGGVRDYVQIGLFHAVVYVGISLSVAERYEECAAFWDYVIDEASRAGAPVVYAIGSCYRAELNLRRGRVVDAEADARTSVRLFHESGVEHLEALAYLAQVLVERDQSGEAVDLLRAAPPPEHPSLWAHYMASFSRGRAMIAEGGIEAGLEDLKLCADPGALSFGSAAVQWRSETAAALHGLGDVATAQALVAEELRLAEAAAAPRAIGAALTVKGAIAARGEAVPILRQAEKTLKETPSVLEHARASVGLGAALRRAGERREMSFVAAWLVRRNAADFASAAWRGRNSRRPERGRAATSCEGGTR